MKNLLFLALFLCSCSRRFDKVEPARGWQQPETRNTVHEKRYEVGRAILPGALGFMGGVMKTDTQRGKFAQQAMFFSATVSIGIGRKRPTKFYLLDLGTGVAGAALGFTVKNQISKR